MQGRRRSRQRRRDRSSDKSRHKKAPDDAGASNFVGLSRRSVFRDDGSRPVERVVDPNARDVVAYRVAHSKWRAIDIGSYDGPPSQVDVKILAFDRPISGQLVLAAKADCIADVSR